MSLRAGHCCLLGPSCKGMSSWATATVALSSGPLGSTDPITLHSQWESGQGIWSLGWPCAHSISQALAPAPFQVWSMPWSRGCDLLGSLICWEIGDHRLPSVRTPTFHFELSSMVDITCPAGLIHVPLIYKLAPSQDFAMTSSSVCDSLSTGLISDFSRDSFK